MSNFKFDLSKFKKTNVENNTATFKNNNGHEIKIAVNKLSPKLREQLDKLPLHQVDGGEAQLIDEQKDKTEQKQQAPVIVNVGSAAQAPAIPAGSEADYPPVTPQEPSKSTASKIGGAVRQGVVDAISTMAKAAQTVGTPVLQAGTDFVQGLAGQTPQSSIASVPPVVQAATAQLPEAQPEGLATEPTSSPSQTAPEVSEQPTMPLGESQLRAGILGEAAAKGRQALAEADVLSAARQGIVDAQKTYTDKLQMLDNERQAFIQDIQQGHINPDKYWDNHSKVATAIGIILAGFNPTNRPNAAIEMLNKQMDDELKSQTANLQSKQNLLSANLQQYGNLKEAEAATRIMLNDITSLKLQEAAVKAVNPIEKARALQAIGKLQAQKDAEQAQLARTLALNSMVDQVKTNPQIADQVIKTFETVDPKKAADLRGRLVPGIGFANTEKDASELKEMKGTVDTAKGAIDRLLELNKKPLRSMNLNERAEAKSLSQTLIGQLRTTILGPGPINDSERKIMEKLIPNPTSFFTLQGPTTTALQTLKKTLDTSMDNRVKSRGLEFDRVKQLSPQQQKFAEWAKANPNDPRSKIVLEKLGL